MSKIQSFTLGLCGIAAGLLLAGAAGPVSASGKGPYAITRHSNNTANAGVFRLDTNSGGVSYCYVNNNAELLCSKEVF